MPRSHHESILPEVLAASIGGAISAALLFPLEVLKTKMQTDENAKQKSMLEYAKELYDQQGYNVFIRGMETSSFQSALEKALYFFSYETLKRVHGVLTNHAPLNTITNLLLGCLAEWAHLPVTLPVDAWTTRIQTCSDKPLAILCHMLNDKQTNFYKGISAYTLLCFKPALQYTIYEQVKRWLLIKRRRAQSLTAAEAFLLGMVARTIATVLVFPCLRAKVVMQTKQRESAVSAGEEVGASESDNAAATTHDETMAQLLLRLARTNPGALYQGMAPELTRGVLSSAIMLMIKERIQVVVRKALAVKQ